MKSLLILLALAITSLANGQDLTFTKMTGESLTLNATSDCFTATDGSFPTVTFRWFRNGVEIVSGPSTAPVALTPQTYQVKAPPLTLVSLTTNDSGIYTITATNAGGTIDGSNKATLTVTVIPPPGAPVITAGLPPAMAARNQTRNFPMGINATGASRYVWKFNNIPLPGQTGPTYIIPKVNPSFGGRYDVDAFSSNGLSVRSSTVLTVLK